ncbi:MAG: DNA repair protein RadC [Erysipelothrix sp.]|nr:DNA repair protein RadC [Erysipelothrix sp.]
MKIKELPDSSRPREKAMVVGLSALSNEELLAIVLRSGYEGKSALALAQEVLETYPLDVLNRITLDDLMKIKGIKTAKALDVLACFELSKRNSLYIGKKNSVINNPDSLVSFIKSEIGGLDNEHFLVVCLNTKNVIIDYKILFIGTVDMAVVHPRDIFKFAIAANATSIICAHNHPSSDVRPSKQDIHITQIIKEAGELVGIKLVDHLIVSTNRVYSILNSIK